MEFRVKDHCGGSKVVPDSLLKDVEAAINNCQVKPGRSLSSAIGKSVIASLIASGWSDEVMLSRESRISISSVKSGVGLCLQTGNVSRTYADLLKLQKLFLDNNIKAGIIIVPNKAAANALGSNIANATRLCRELDIFKKVIHLPLVVYSFE